MFRTALRSNLCFGLICKTVAGTILIFYLLMTTAVCAGEITAIAWAPISISVGKFLCQDLRSVFLQLLVSEVTSFTIMFHPCGTKCANNHG